jgi:ABC-2 type transport system permease protein
MNKVWLIFQREFLNRVQKKSFLVATILLPLIFPLILGVMVYVMLQQEGTSETQTIAVYDESGRFNLENENRYSFVPLAGDFENAKSAFSHSDYFALLYIPEFDLMNPEGIALYTKENPSIRKIEELENMLEERIHDLKLAQFNIDKTILQNLKTTVRLNNINISESGEEKESNTGPLYILGFILGVLIYMFVLIYGMQIMLGVIEEKTSKVVEILLSSVKPFQLMMGKILAVAAVGLLQFTIWVLLISFLSTATLSLFGLTMPQQQAMEQISRQLDQGNGDSSEEMELTNTKVIAILKSLHEIPFGYILFNFAFYFLGGYLLYGALFAAVGAAVDTQQEAQQFTFPITLPLIIAYFGLFMFILNDPDSPASFWFSIIPFTSPVAMVGRLGFHVPLWELLLSQFLLVGGFLFTTWIAARIYRVGILMHGAKMNYKVLVKWFMMKH